ncbi:hypothetical protein [Nocardia lasii]|uniref:Uncharacterized protein n=1 Tax=Nocardia lasii TaxID=1616107 RepID=A0ABW1JQC4_9NOCA
MPRSAEIALLLLVSLGAGVLACGDARGRCVRMISTLIAGQWVGHFALSTTLDHHGGPLQLPGLPMTFAHIVAAFVCAALIFVAERLYLVASSVIRSILGRPSSPVRRTSRWIAAAAVARGARLRGVRCPRAPPLFV